MTNKTTALILCCLTSLLSAATSRAQDLQPWPATIPCRVQDGSNKYLWIMTLGQPQSALADGVFDPLSDQVKLKDGSVKSNYFRDTLKVPFYQPLEFIVLGDGKELWRNSHVKAGQVPVPIRLDITGVRTLTLQVKGPGSRSRLQADWVEPKLELRP